MPTISRLFGITIRIYFDDHAPAHFHAYYAEFSATIVIVTLMVLHGHLPNRTLALVVEWACEHREALQKDWRLAHRGLPLESIAPLE